MNTEDLFSKEFAISLFLIFIGSAFGVLLPDLDQRLLKVSNFIQHRSILTHSCLLGWVFYWLAKREKAELFSFFAVGIFIGLAVHLSFDLFPRRWWGVALIYIPLVGNLRNIPLDGDLLPPLFSFVWILGNIWICFAFVQRIIGTNQLKMISAIVITLIVFLITSHTERTFWLPFFVLLICLLTSFKEKEIREKTKEMMNKFNI